MSIEHLQNKTKQNSTKRNKTKQNKTKQNWLKSLSLTSLLLIGMSCSTDDDLVEVTSDKELTSLSSKLNTTFEAENYDSQSGIQKSNGGNAVGYIQNGDWIRFDDFDYDGAQSITISAASNNSGGTIELRAGSSSGGDLLGTIAITNTGGWTNFQNFTANINDNSNNSDLYLKFTGGSGYLFDVNSFKLSGVGSTSGGSISAYSRIQAESYNDDQGIQKSNGGAAIGYIATGDWVKYENVDFGGGAQSVKARVSKGNSGTGTIQFRRGSSTGTLMGSMSFGNTGGWTSFQELSADISNSSGTHDLYLVFTGNLDVDWFEFSEDGGDPGNGGGNSPYEALGLDRWKVTLPKDEGGDSDADEVFYSASDNDYSGDAALTSYSDEFFYVNNSGNVIFECPADYNLPKTSSGTSNTRTELREMPYRSGNEDGWDAGGSTVREMSFRVRVMQTSSTRKLAFAQIHDYGEANWDDLIRIQIQSDNANATVGDTGKIYIMGDMAEGLSSEGVSGQSDADRTILSNYTLGDWLDIRVTYNNDTIRIYLNGSSTAAQTYTGADCPSNYFKAGCYNQSMNSSSSGTGIVEFQSLSVTSNF